MNHKNIRFITVLYAALTYSFGYAMDQPPRTITASARTFIDGLNEYLSIDTKEDLNEANKQNQRALSIEYLKTLLTAQENQPFTSMLNKKAPNEVFLLETLGQDTSYVPKWIEKSNITVTKDLKRTAYQTYLSNQTLPTICEEGTKIIDTFGKTSPQIMLDDLAILNPFLVQKLDTSSELVEEKREKFIQDIFAIEPNAETIKQSLKELCGAKKESDSSQDIDLDTKDIESFTTESNPLFSMSSIEFNNNALSSSTLFASSLSQSGILTTDQTSDPYTLFMEAHGGISFPLGLALQSNDNNLKKEDLEYIVTNIKTMIGYIIDNDLFDEEKQKNPIKSYRVYQLTAAQKMIENIISQESESYEIPKNVLKAMKEEIDAVYKVTTENIGLREKGQTVFEASRFAVGKAIRFQQKEEKKEKQRQDFVAKQREADRQTKANAWLQNNAKNQVEYIKNSSLSNDAKIYILQLLWFQIKQDKVDTDAIDTSNINDARMREYTKEIKNLGSSIDISIKESPLFPYPEFKNIPEISGNIDTKLQKFIEQEKRRIALAKELTGLSLQIEQAVFNRPLLQRYKNALEEYKLLISPSERSLSKKINLLIDETDKKIKTLSRLKVVSRKKVVLSAPQKAAGRAIMQQLTQEKINQTFQEKAAQIIQDIAASQKEILDAQEAQNKKKQELFAQQEKQKIELEEKKRKEVEAGYRLYDEKLEAIKQDSINKQISLKKQEFETLITEKGISIICSNDIFKNATGINLLALIQVLKEKLETIKISSDDQSSISLVPGWIAVLESSFEQGINIEKSDELITAIDSICKVGQKLFPTPEPKEKLEADDNKNKCEDFLKNFPDQNTIQCVENLIRELPLGKSSNENRNFLLDILKTYNKVLKQTLTVSQEKIDTDKKRISEIFEIVQKNQSNLSAQSSAKDPQDQTIDNQKPIPTADKGLRATIANIYNTLKSNINNFWNWLGNLFGG